VGQELTHKLCERKKKRKRRKACEDLGGFIWALAEAGDWASG